jgi:zinc/manganese transport system substrate-binding protein
VAGALADQVGTVEVVELHTESLGEPGGDADTYVAMMRTNGQRVAQALGSPAAG